jgi:hypothetical protein
MTRENTRSYAILVYILWTFLSVAASAAPGEDPKGAGAEKGWTEFDLEIGKGDYIFIGTEDANPDVHEIDRGVKPEILVTVPEKSDHDVYKLRLRLNLSGAGDLESPLFLEGIIYEKSQDASKPDFRISARRWQYPAYKPAPDAPKPKVEKLKPEMITVADPPAGVKMWRIPYAKVNGHVRGLLVASSRSSDSLEKAIRIPKAFILFKWHFDEVK